jgi:hypothetical protein
MRKNLAIGLAGLVALIVLVMAVNGGSEGGWEELAPGMDLGTFRAGRMSPVGDSTITILRIDPERWEIELLSISEKALENVYSARRWSEEHGLAAAFNAGMFATDRNTHVGYMRREGHVNSARENKYQSVAAFRPRRPGIPPFRIFDLDDGETTIPRLTAQYNCVIQNLRLIKRPRMNRWQRSDRMWSEAALGEDGDGRVLLIFSRSPFSMHGLNEILMSLPIDLVCAQHLEGGPEAQLYVSVGDTEIEMVGSFETNFWESDANLKAWPIPNVIGVIPKAGPIEEDLGQ